MSRPIASDEREEGHHVLREAQGAMRVNVPMTAVGMTSAAMNVLRMFAQEEEHDHDREAAAVEQMELDLLDGVLDEDRDVLRELESDPARGSSSSRQARRPRP